MTGLKSWLQINPIIVKELRSRMRGGRAFITLTVSLLVTAGLMYGLLQIMLALAAYQTDILSPRIGQSMFTALAFLELAMVCIITPAVTSGAISGEREKLTLEMLQATPLSTSSILWGKLVSALSFVVLLLFAGIPLASLVFIFGGVAPIDMVKALLVLLVLSVFFGVLGLFMSALFRRTGRATVASFLVVLLLTFAPLFLAIAIGMMRQGEPPRWIMSPSPVSLLASVMGSTYNQSSVLGQIVPFLGGYWLNSAIAPISQTSIPRPLYHYALPGYAGMTLILYLLTTRLLQPARRWRLKRKEILIGLGLVVGFAALVAAAFLGTARRYEWVKPAATATEVGLTAPAVPSWGGPQTTATPVLSATSLDAAAQAQIYTAVVRQIFTVDNTMGGQTGQFKTIYLVNATGDRAGDPTASADNSAPIPAEVQQGISAALKDLNVSIQWVDGIQAVPRDEKTGAVQDGVIIYVGNIYERGNPDEIQVAGSIYIASMAAGGRSYILTNVNGEYRITGTTGVEWIS